MTLEACDTFGWPFTQVARRLRRHPEEIRKLVRFRAAVQGIADAGFLILPVLGEQVLRAAELSQQLGILSSDALIVAMMQAHSLTHLASNDADFDQVTGISRYAPV